MQNFILFLIFCCIPFVIKAQEITGYVTDTEGDPLPFASVYIEGTSKGTSTNLEGYFSLKIDRGQHVLVVRFVGYRTFRQAIEMDGEAIELEVTLESSALEIDEIVVRASDEDPAFQIIRNAMERRNHYLNHIEKQKSSVYIKGTYYLTEKPESVFGVRITEGFETLGARDSLENPIVYLAETESFYYKMNPNHRREVVKSTQVSGDSRGVTFNSALLMDINLYRSNVEIVSTLKSPIGQGAFTYYDYRLEGTTMGDDGSLLYAIRLLPKNPHGPVFGGLIYIRDSSWNIVEADMWVTGRSVQNQFVDTIAVRQIHIPLEDDKWVLFQQNLDITASLMGFTISGGFTAVFSDYDLNPDIDRNFFRSEIIGFGEEFNQRSVEYWDSIRPIPLIEQEQWDYRFKDSLEQVRSDPHRIDSLDRRYNRPRLVNLITGYNFRKRNKDISGKIYSPLSDLYFNTVQGTHISLRGEVTKGNAFKKNDELKLEGLVNYGFSEEQFRGQGSLRYQFNKIDRSTLTLSGGSKVAQFNETQPVSEFANSLYSLFLGRNYAKYYQKRYLRLQFSSRPARWISGQMSLEYADRSTLVNTSDYSFRSDPKYTPNQPILDDGFVMDDHRAWTGRLRLNFHPQARYVSFPEQRVYTSVGNWPQMSVGVDAGFYPEGDETAFVRLFSEISYNRSMGVWGRSTIWLNGGLALSDEENFEFVDYKHFWGNRANFGFSADYPRRFFNIDHYLHSTAGNFLQIHYSHNFEGEIMRRIPLIRYLQSQLITGYKMLHTEEGVLLQELHAGLGNLGFGIFRVLRVDVAFSFDRSEYRGSHFSLGINIPVNRPWYR